MNLSIRHVAIVVRDMDAALRFYRDALGLEMTERRQVPEEAVEIAFLSIGKKEEGGEIELIQPLDGESGAARFLAKRGEGLHHICLAVEDVEAAMERLRAAGVRLLDEEPRVDVHGVRYVFVHPQSAHGVLMELYEATE
jgi:methylmalonyl-CoA epimerase